MTLCCVPDTVLEGTGKTEEAEERCPILTLYSVWKSSTKIVSYYNYGSAHLMRLVILSQLCGDDSSLVARQVREGFFRKERILPSPGNVGNRYVN